MPNALKRLTKGLAGRMLYATGRQRRLLRGGAVIVAFHSIGEDAAASPIRIRPDHFRQYCEFFKQHFDVTPLATLLDLLEAGKDVSGRLVITFDDGYRDNYTNAAPVLEATGLPATFFIATDFIGSTSTPPWDRQWGVKSEWMSWDEVVDLDRRGFDIGAHTRSHPVLTQCTIDEARREIAGSKSVLEHKLGHAVSHFAYPFGRRTDSNDTVRSLVAQAGFRCCVSCHGGVVTPGADLMELPRLPINDWFDSPYHFGLDVVRDVRAVGGEYSESRPMGDGVLVVSYHMYPDAEIGARRPSELMRFLAAEGYRVAGLAGRPSATGRTDAELLHGLQGLRIMRVPQPPSITTWLWMRIKTVADRARKEKSATGAQAQPTGPGRAGRGSAIGLAGWLRRHYHAMFSLLDAHKTWALLAALRACFSWGQRYSIVISSGPPSASHVAGYLAAKWHRARYVMDFRDPWVGNHIDSSSNMSRLRYWLETRAERACIRRAETVTVTTPGIERMLRARYPEHSSKLKVVYNGYDGAPAAPTARQYGRLDLLYAGTLYMNRNPFPILEAFKIMVGQPGVARDNTSMTFVGHCDTWNGQSLPEWVAVNGMSDVVHIHPPVSRRELEEFTGRSTVLVNFAQGQPDQIPAKTFEYLASGRLMLLVTEANSSTAELVKGVPSVVLATPSDSAAELAETLSRLYQLCMEEVGHTDPGNQDVSRFSREAQHHRFVALLRRGGSPGSRDSN